jgi:DNA-binding transcriptional MerR regulator
MADKLAGALLTIGEVAELTGVAPHILRYWESRFPQLQPVKRAGNRRYYRTHDVELVHSIQRLLGEQGYSLRGAQQVLKAKHVPPPPASMVDQLIAIRGQLAQALARS